MLSSKASAMATSFVPGTFRVWEAAPVPRPPQPMRATLISDSLMPCAKEAMGRAEAAATTPVVLMNFLRFWFSMILSGNCYVGDGWFVTGFCLFYECRMGVDAWEIDFLVFGGPFLGSGVRWAEEFGLMGVLGWGRDWG